MEDGNQGDLENRLSVRHKVESSCRTGIETFFEGVRKVTKEVIAPYISIAKNPEKPFYALGDIVKNVAEMPIDFYKFCRGKYRFSFEKKVSRSLAIAETLVLVYGAQKGAHLMSNYNDNRFIQAGVGGFIGSEGITALAFFGTYFAYTFIISMHGKRGAVRHKLKSALKVTSKASLTILPAGLLSYGSADLGIASLAVLFGASSGLAAQIGAIGGLVLYPATAKVALHTSAENGYLKEAESNKK